MDKKLLPPNSPNSLYTVNVVRASPTNHVRRTHDSRPLTVSDAIHRRRRAEFVHRLRIYFSLVVAAVTLVASGHVILNNSQEVPTGYGLESNHANLVQDLRHVTTLPQRTRIPGYERSKFGTGWQHAPQGLGCTVRHVAISMQVSGEASCTISGELFDPYNSEFIDLAHTKRAVEVDHIFPLSAAWDHGAWQWTDAQRVAFANDPRNLVVTSSESNQEKSDQLPGEWMPKTSGCWYARRVAEIAAAYQLSLSAHDKRTMRWACLEIRR
ncbi:MAG: HNH endonuclease family protein [Corynebacterium sp.]|nr:HNH endonuclease family protein [Corynebacterium sp.]